MKLVVMFPDYRGEGVTGNFARSLEILYGSGGNKLPLNTTFLAVVNGLSPQELAEIDDRAKELLPDNFGVIVSKGKGVVPVLADGYEHIIKHHAEADVVVRIDTGEHDINYIPVLAKEAIARRGMIVGDLEFGVVNGVPTMIEESPEWLVAKEIWPRILRVASAGLLEGLSNTHGFQAFGSASTIARLLPTARLLVAHSQVHLNGPLRWGFDLAMIMAALLENVPLKIIKVPALQLRNRALDKIFVQLEAHLAVCCGFLAERTKVLVRGDQVGLGVQKTPRETKTGRISRTSIRTSARTAATRCPLCNSIMRFTAHWWQCTGSHFHRLNPSELTDLRLERKDLALIRKTMGNRERTLRDQIQQDDSDDR